MLGKWLQRMLILSVLNLAPVLSLASVQVFGLEQDSLANLESREQLTGRIDEVWTHLNRWLKVPTGSDPLIYLYPFDRKLQPQKLTALQERFIETLPELKDQPARLANLFSMINGITYDPSLFDAGSDEAGRLIQINTDRSYRSENAFDRGYGLYITSHEMVHVALNRLGIDPKYQHCLMIDEDHHGQSLMRQVLSFLIDRDWASPMLTQQTPLAKGYAEEAQHCAADLTAIRREGGPKGLTAFWSEVREIHQRLAY